MPIAYTEGRSLAINLYADLRAAILASSDWSSLVSEAAILTSTAASTAGATTMTFASGTPAAAGIIVGATVRIGARTDPLVEYRQVTAVAATTFTVAALTYAHPNGTSIYWGNEVFKATTTRGADMIFDLTDAAQGINDQKLQITAYSAFQTGVQTNPSLNPHLPSTRYLSYRGNTLTPITTTWIYWTVSVSKEHVFIMLEGPRTSDVNPENSSYGSCRSYMFMCDLVPYFSSALDPTPAVVMHMSPNTAFKAATDFSHKVNISNTHDGKFPLAYGYLHTLDLAGNQVGPLVANRMGLDGNLFLAPYVYFDDTYGIRGRLGSLFYAGPSTATQDWVGVPVTPNTFSVYNGIKYKLLAVNKTAANGNGVMGGPLGWFNNTSGQPNFLSSPIVAVPYGPA